MAPRALLLFSSLASLSLSCCAASAAPAQCDPRGYCPSTCSRPGAVESDGFQLLYGQSALWTSVRKAVDVMRRFPGVLTDDALDPHTTFQYLCCLTPAELTEKVFPAMDAVQWAPVRASYAKAVCNVDGSVILLADDATQAQMSAVVEKLEAAIEATGLPVIPRATMQSFHITLGTTNASFPMAEALAAINAAVTDWAPPFDISEFSFFLPVPHTVRARGAQAAPPHIDNDLQLFNPAAVRRSSAASAIVTLNVSEPVADGDFIQVQVDNPEHADRGDFVALFLASAAPEETVPLKWTYLLPYFPSYQEDGRANVSMQVYGVRAPVVFRLFSGTTSAPVLLASSPAVAFADYGAPLHPRVLNGARSGDFAVAWTTDEESANASRPVLRWGVGAAGEYPNAAAAEAAFVRKGDLCGAPATATGWMDLGATVVAQLPGLGAFAGQTVHYALADDERTSDDFSFVVPPQPGANAYPYKFAAFGDLGRGSNDDGITWREYGTPAKNASAWLAKETGLLFVHHFGDLSYACGFLQSWDEYLWMISPFASRNVYLPGYGNHGELGGGRRRGSRLATCARARPATASAPLPPSLSLARRVGRAGQQLLELLRPGQRLGRRVRRRHRDAAAAARAGVGGGALLRLCVGAGLPRRPLQRARLYGGQRAAGVAGGDAGGRGPRRLALCHLLAAPAHVH